MKTISGVQQFFVTEEPIKLVGVGATYTYQATGIGSASVYGCNDLIINDWVFILFMDVGDSACVLHSWRYIKSIGDAVVTCSRGSR